MLESKWMPLLYQYGIGGLVFFGAIFLALKVKAANLSNKTDRATIRFLVIGFIIFFSLHLFFILISGA